MVLTTSLSLYILSQPPEKIFPCQLLVNLRSSYLVSIMASGTVAVLFRWELKSYKKVKRRTVVDVEIVVCEYVTPEEGQC